jgi:uncharacterized protein (TIGR03083 family)
MFRLRGYREGELARGDDMAVMTPAEWVDSYEASALQIIDRTSTNLDEPVPCCPGWAGRDLLRHVGRAPAIWNAIMDTPPGGFPELDWKQLSAAVPVDDEALAAWARVQTSRYAERLRQRDPDSWAFNIGPNTTTWMWMRRAAAEMAVHLWDAESLSGSPSDVPTNLAADGLEELTELIPNFLARTAAPVPAPVTVVATDFDGAWTFGSPAASEDAALVRGAAGDLFFRLWGRPTTGLSGAIDILDEWAHLPFAEPPPRLDSIT